MNQIVTNPKNSKTTMQVNNHKLKVRLAMRTAFLALCAVLFALPVKAQQLPDPFNMTRGTYTVQNQKVYKFYDSGGPDLYTPEEDPNNDYNWVTWYQPNEDITVTLNPGTAGYGVQVDFSFDKAYLNINNDYLSFYDGDILTMNSEYTSQVRYTQLSWVNNVLGVQEIIKAIRALCPKIRYSFIDGDDLVQYRKDVQTVVIDKYRDRFKSCEIEYVEDEVYDLNKVIYAVIKIKFRNFVQTEMFKIIALN